MKITIIDGIYKNEYKEKLEKIVNILKKSNSDVEIIDLSKKRFAPCIGCWTCWKKTPGICIHKDDTPTIYKRVINSDLVIYASENSLGALTSLSKRQLDKAIILIHPHIKVINNESRHVARYEKYPKWGLLFFDEENNTEDYNLVLKHLKRAALNSYTELVFNQLIDKEFDCNENNINKWFA